jgi:hypothetical protein
MMTTWDTYPDKYRAGEVREIVSAVQAGECAAVIGLSGSGKSNLLGFVANRVSAPVCRFVLVDCNRLAERSTEALFRLMRRSMGSARPVANELEALDELIDQRGREWGEGVVIGLLLDRFDDLAQAAPPALYNNLRALRDAHKYRLSLVIAARRPLAGQTELAELFHAHTLWLGALSASDARWSAQRYAERKGLSWDGSTLDALVQLTRGYPSFLRAACEAYASGASLDARGLAAHPAVRARLDEFFADHPTDEELRRTGLQGLALLAPAQPLAVDTSRLTSKEHALLIYFQAHAGAVCEKDDLIRAVWPEDQIVERGLRDDSLAQLVRRLREKIEPDPSNPRHVHTVPGRGYRFTV